MTNQELQKSLEDMIKLAKERDLLEGRYNVTIEDVDIDEKIARFRYKADPADQNIYGGVHGGTTATIFDYAMGILLDALTEKYMSTIQLNIQYLKPMLADEYILECQALHVGRKVCQTIAKFIDASTGVPTAQAQASYVVVAADKAVKLQ
ncbi:MAG: PaaI family thioesterase [Firmicutes bacterium]|nr:PaaI family thioesterase [Bacillota bacterium]